MRVTKVSDKMFDADFHTKMVAVDFKKPPRESLTIQDVLDIRKSEDTRKRYKNLLRR